MSSAKMNIRDLLIRKKDQYAIENNRRYIIEAAVLKGVYYGVGGSKVIVLPTFCSIIVDSLRYVTRAKEKFTGDILKDVGRLGYEITKNVGGVSSLDLDITGEYPVIYVYIGDKKNPFNIEIKTKNSNKYLADVGVTLIMNLSEQYKFSINELNIIHRAFEDCLKYLDRGL